MKDPARNVPGGVIGKVLGGVRVEEVFSDGTRWKLRTPKGVFLLQLTVDEFEEVRWGDGDNILVARTPLGQGRPNRVVAYEVQRQPGTVELMTVDMPDGPEAQVMRKTEAVFPFGMSLGTTVDFSQTIQYRQRLARTEHKSVFRWVPLLFVFPDNGTYEFAGDEVGLLTVETARAESVGFSESFAITLDLERNSTFGTVDRPYVWELREVAATVTGRLLGVVVVSLTTPQSAAVSLPVLGLNQNGGLEAVSQVSFFPSFPTGLNPLLWAI